jgi:Tol biopolymer transport system component
MTPMTADQWQQVKEITAEALEKPADERPGFVAKECGDDAEVLREVMRLLAEADRSSFDNLFTTPGRLAALLSAHFAPCFGPDELVAGRFRILEFLNDGGMGEVYSARDLELQETVALKTIRPAIAASPAIINRFKQEVRQARRIAHRNVCRVYDLFSHEPGSGPPIWFLTMEFLDGQTLAQHLAAAGPMPMQEALPLIRDMVSALATAHDFGIVHRDFKPSNVMLVNSGDGALRAVVTDFGLALSVAADQPADHGGTPAYMAPELAAGGTVTFAADQFALGLVICEMLSGLRPALNSPAALPAALNPRAQAVVCRCLERRPEDRFAHVREIVPILDGSRERSRIRRGLAVAVGLSSLLILTVAVARQDWGVRLNNAVQLTPGTDLAGYPTLSRDGKSIAYMSDGAEPGNLDIWIQSFPGGLPRRLTTNPTEDREPSISPGGDAVVFRSERDGGGIYLVGADGAGERMLAPGGRNPGFSPDGKSVVYWSGDLDDTSPSGKIYAISLDGTPPRRLASDFADARYPQWSSDGRAILFEGCHDLAQLPACAEWWALPNDGSAAVNLGVVALLRNEKLEPRHDRAWCGTRVIFSAVHGPATSLYELTLSPSELRVRGRPRRVTADDAIELEPSLADAGAIAFGRGSAARHIWQIPAQPDGAGAHDIRVTDDPQWDDGPSVSGDGRQLFLARRTGYVRQVIKKDLVSGRESAVSSSDADQSRPVSDATGARVAFESHSQGESSIWMVSEGRPARMLCRDCSYPTSWFDGGGALFHTTAKGEIALLNADTGGSHVVLPAGRGMVLAEADWSPEHEYLLFTVARNGAPKQVFAVRFPRAGEKPEGPWVEITSEPSEVDRPRWSTDGTTVYYLSKRDGFYCVWAVRFDAPLGQPDGSPFPIHHYHNQRFSPYRIVPYARSLSVGSNSVFLNVGEWTISLWKGSLKRPLPLSLFY